MWAGLPALSLGFASPFFFIQAAARRFNAWTLALAVATTALFVGFFLAEPDSPWETACAVLNWVVGGGLALAMRGYVFGPPAGAAPAGRAPQPEPDGWARERSPLLAEARRLRETRAHARELMERDPLVAKELGVGRPDRDREFDDGGVVDLNNAPEQVISRINGVTVQHAQALVRARRMGGRFSSVADAVIRADLPAELEEVLAEYAVFG
ncbi:hypothetical protein DEF23_05590 [Marinitenerispora sediminis]|uniref:Helix-hairpin-helix domain-containing protein n=1 Tax=Marinitenerispora sediminis TaxID=1931232 RepID=A0A368T0U0_9ACTN|nr:hypothetical protein DEF24_20895 [Marinitenerispora sediminis]RCV56525.1 hypothetical protein DEF28_03400 [Marinitenerispora sediminis]RCV60124.1 hypothetical protein DEF23_05590 [Marinitenerispora sediminis]